MKLFKVHQKCMPQRVFVCLMAFLGLTICNMMRFALSLTLTFIALPKIKKEGKLQSSQCPKQKSIVGSKKKTVDALYEWDEQIQAKLLAGFFWGYVITQFPGGILSDMIGPRRVVFWSCLLTSINSLLVGPITRLCDWPGLLVLRILTGLFQGAFYASLHSVVAVWVPKEERGILGSFVFVGAHMGNFGSVAVTGFLLEGLGQKQWDFLFYIYGGFGTLWSLLFYFMTYDNFTQCPEGLLKEKEKNKMEAYYESIQKKKRIKFTEVPWSMIATNLPTYSIAIAIWGHCWGIFIMINNIPKFMASVLGFDVSSNGLYLGGAYLLMTVVSFASGFLVDWMVKKNTISITWNRVLFTSIGSILPSLGLLGVSYCECDGVCAFACLIFGMAGMGCFYPSLKVNGIDLSSNFGGTVGSVSHWLGTTAGAMGPPVVAMMAPDNTISQYRGVMWLTFILMSATNVFYILFASANIQKFNYYQKNSDESDQAGGKKR